MTQGGRGWDYWADRCMVVWVVLFLVLFLHLHPPEALKHYFKLESEEWITGICVINNSPLLWLLVIYCTWPHCSLWEVNVNLYPWKHNFNMLHMKSSDVLYLKYTLWAWHICPLMVSRRLPSEAKFCSCSVIFQSFLPFFCLTKHPLHRFTSLACSCLASGLAQMVPTNMSRRKRKRGAGDEGE